MTYEILLLSAAQAAAADPAELGKLAIWAAAGAAVVRVLMAIARSGPIVKFLGRFVPEWLRPIAKFAAPILLACALAFLEALASGRPLGEAVLVGLGAWAGSQGTFGAQRAVKKAATVRKGGSIQLPDAGMMGPRP